MVNRERLKQTAQRAYEYGRLRVAARAAWVLVPATVVCAFATGAKETCACVGALLLGAAVFLRWRDRMGVDSVRYGLFAGALPLIAGLIATRVAPFCAEASLLSACALVCLGIGVPCGVWLGLRLVRSAANLSTWFATFGVAVLAANLGCLGLGIGGIVGVSSGLLLGVSPMLTSVALARRSGRHC